jgi:hypothetical protein
MSVALVVAAVAVVWSALLLLAVGLCMSARDGDRNIAGAGDGDRAPRRTRPRKSHPPVAV